MMIPWPESWDGENPVCLMIALPREAIMQDQVGQVGWADGAVTVIDLDEHLWKTTYAWIFSTPAEWHLVRKSDKAAILSMHVLEGNQPYYVARHIVSVKGPAAGKRVVAYGIGKKAKRKSQKRQRWEWNQDNLWWLPWGQVCGGTDVELFALSGLAKGLPTE